MNASQKVRLTLATDSAEVVTEHTRGIGYVTTINAPMTVLDGAKFLTRNQPDAQHTGAVLLARDASKLTAM